MIATLAQFKQYLGITGTSQDTILQLLIDSSNSMINSYIGRIIEADDYIEYVNGNAQREILLQNYPVNTLTSIEKNIWDLETPVWEIVEPTWYKLSPKEWKIFLVYPLTRGFQNYKITYNAWYDPVPAELTLASLKIASKYYNTRTSDGVASESVNGDSISFETTEIPSDVLVILNNYRDIYV